MVLQFFDPGMLRLPVELQSCQTMPDGQGGSMRTWQTMSETFAHIDPIGAASPLRGGFEGLVVTHRVTMRYRDDLKQGDRILHGLRVLNVQSTRDLDETKRYLVCRCEEIS